MNFSGQKPESALEANSWWLTFGSILVLNIVTRFYNVHLPKWVCWDETHFGKMGSWYINQGGRAMSCLDWQSNLNLAIRFLWISARSKVTRSRL